MNRPRIAALSLLAAAWTLTACSSGGGTTATPTPGTAATQAPSAAAGGTPTGPGGAPTVNVVTFVPSQTNDAPNVTTPITARAETADPDGDGVTVTWKWYLNGAEMIGESLDSIRPGRYKKNDKIEAEATPKDTRGNVGTPLRGSIVVRNSIPQLTSQPSGSLNGYKPVLVDADIGDPNERHTWALEQPVPGFTLAADGTLKFDAAAGKDANGKSVTIMVTDSNGAVARQTFDVRF